MRNFVMYVLVPGITGFAMAYIFVIPQLVAVFPALASSNVATVGATGLLTFAMASVLRGRGKAEALVKIDAEAQRA
ncbi:MAG: hypothetical protein NXH79_10535 [Rhodobacteraceae bacterium]|jgi:predicted amino acid dehydrogenase|nr:hypothetical protein [Paracoccaceae bacterium]